jgi:hypothetical protein
MYATGQHTPCYMHHHGRVPMLASSLSVPTSVTQQISSQEPSRAKFGSDHLQLHLSAPDRRACIDYY